MTAGGCVLGEEGVGGTQEKKQTEWPGLDKDNVERMTNKGSQEPRVEI